MLSHIRSKISLLFLSLALAVYAQDGNCDYGPDTCINGKFLFPSFAEPYRLTRCPFKATFGGKLTQAM